MLPWVGIWVTRLNSEDISACKSTCYRINISFGYMKRVRINIESMKLLRRIGKISNKTSLKLWIAPCWDTPKWQRPLRYMKGYAFVEMSITKQGMVYRQKITWDKTKSNWKGGKMAELIKTLETQAWGPEFEAWIPHGSSEITRACCSLTSI